MLADDAMDCHVLVIGSGGAGVRAALEAAKYGDTILLSRTLTGKGGCTTMAEGGYNAVLRAQDSPALHVQDTMEGGAWLNDPALVEVLVREAPERMRDLLAWGAVFDVTEGREIAQRPFGGQRFPRTCYAGDRTGHEMILTLVEQLRRSDVVQLQEHVAIELLKDGERVCGAIALDRKNELVVVKADAVVLATGGGTRVYDISTNSASGTGDGYALGYRAGAELIDMEMVQFHPTGAVYPYDARGRLVTEAVRGEGGVLKNALGERFMERYDPVRKELSTRDVVSRAIAREVLEGRGTIHGGVHLDVSHLPSHVIEERLPIMLEQFLRFGVDIRKEPMEVAPTAHHIMGGLRITPECHTTLAGLYACGEVTGGVHGANRLGGNALADTQVFGKRAGEAAGKGGRRSIRIGRGQVEVQERRLERFYAGDTNPAEAARQLRLLMWEKAGIFRSEEGLLRARREISRLSGLIPLASSRHSLVECCTLENMLLLSSLIVEGALLRRESRGAHMRVDVTQTWGAKDSSFGHTVQSLEGRKIERRGA
ncbi:MAG: fumarate reductase subunit A [Methanomicrobiales archaeon]|nr:fumarate reductase subunit A [Methanomicrobiales archaeon]